MKTLFQFHSRDSRTFVFKFSETSGGNERITVKEDKKLTEENIKKIDQRRKENAERILRNNEKGEQENILADVFLFADLDGEFFMEELGEDLKEAFQKLPASAFLSFNSEQLQKLFLNGGVVDFRGNNNAKREIGLSDLYPKTSNSQQYLVINNITYAYGARRHDGKIGYGNPKYKAIKGGEVIEFVSNKNIPQEGSKYSYEGLASKCKGFESDMENLTLEQEEGEKEKFLKKLEKKEEIMGKSDEEIDNGENMKGETLWNSPRFQKKLQEVCSALGVKPIHMKTVMMAESGMNPKAVNPITGATGLIQFMPRTAQGLEISTDELRSMDSVAQLDFVQDYFKDYAGRLNSAEDLYMVTFFPMALGKADDWVLQTSELSAELIARQNPVISQGEEKITVSGFKDYVRRKEVIS